MAVLVFTIIITKETGRHFVYFFFYTRVGNADCQLEPPAFFLWGEKKNKKIINRRLRAKDSLFFLLLSQEKRAGEGEN